MSQEEYKRLCEAVKASPSLREELKAASDNHAVVAIARAAGFMISLDDLEKDQAELSEGELEEVAGGARAHRIASHSPCHHSPAPEVVTNSSKGFDLKSLYHGQCDES